MNFPLKDLKKTKKYRVQIRVSVYRDNMLSYKSEFTVPTVYSRRSEARGHIKKEIKERLSHSMFFRSSRLDYDLVKYSEEASCNTFLRYSIIEE